MQDNQTCRACGVVVPHDAPFGHCPGCLIDLGFQSSHGNGESDRPSSFEDFQLIEPIGRGGMGVVYKARQRSLNRLIAIKMLNPQSAAFPRIAERLRVEAEAAAGLHHRGIVAIHYVGEHNGQPFLAMELVEGCGLDQFITLNGYHASPDSGRNGSAASALRASVRIIVAVAQAVDYAHKRGVLHRDIKPANILIDAAGEPHLTDFGLAKILGRDRVRETDPGSVLGTPAYMAPEQAAGDNKRVSSAADTYSLGAILYEMLTGRPPFCGESPLETLRQVTQDEPRHPSALNWAVDSDLATICLKCLEKIPERRYSTAKELAEDLGRWQRQEPIAARPVGPWERFRRWCQREPRLAAMTVGLFVLLLASTLLALALYHHEKERAAFQQREHGRERDIHLNRIIREWASGQGRLSVTAQELAVIDEQRFQLEGSERTMILGVHTPRTNSNPIRVLQRFARVVHSLQTNISGGSPVVFNLEIYKSYAESLEGFRAGQVDLIQMSPASYLQLRREMAGVTPLAWQLTGQSNKVSVVFFTRLDSAVHNIADLRGRALAFDLTSFPLIEDAGKATLFSAGLRAPDMAAVTNVAHSQIISAVYKGGFEAGVTEAADVDRQLSVGVKLRIIQRLQVPGYVWVASPRLKPEDTRLLRERLIALPKSDALISLDEELTGFGVAYPEDFNEMEEMIRQAREFDVRKER